MGLFSEAGLFTVQAVHGAPCGNKLFYMALSDAGDLGCVARSK